MHDVNPDLLTLDDAEFAKLYEDRIEPILRAREAERLAALSTSRGTSLGGALSASVMLGVLALVLSMNLGIGLLGALVGFIFARASGPPRPTGVYESAEKQTLAALAEAVGCSYAVKGSQDAVHARLLNLNMLPRSRRARFEDQFTGRHKGYDFSFCKAFLENQSDDGWFAVFKGYLVRVAFSRKFAGTTIVRRDAGSLGNWFERMNVSPRLERVRLGGAELDKAFEVYTTDQFEARYLADFAFIDRLTELEARFEGRDLRCAFEKGDLLIAVETGPRVTGVATDPHFFDRLMIYETYHKAGVSVDEEKAEEIERTFDAQETKKNPLDTMARARAFTAEVAQILRLIDNVLEPHHVAAPDTPDFRK